MSPLNLLLRTTLFITYPPSVSITWSCSSNSCCRSVCYKPSFCSGGCLSFRDVMVGSGFVYSPWSDAGQSVYWCLKCVGVRFVVHGSSSFHLQIQHFHFYIFIFWLSSGPWISWIITPEDSGTEPVQKSALFYRRTGNGRKLLQESMCLDPYFSTTLSLMYYF